ncbi:DUF2795 domain-containing protein [Streptomyces sp. MST-110588]|uniref:DUF2795 domain-containing protein n=1 Tax=Streptomyces sp. MST-110588 TaxID=2833628 RepID=UPI001F5C2413|nr:DUF2795 domain-containing protein [Streptomyces sp. MST-110588]UNO39829.1 DUF2795 domain-containing protein [Streptomyces sp. MST-110588]
MADTNPIELQKALKGAHYPAGRKDLVECAKSNKADSELVDKISHLRENRFKNPAEVEKAVFHGK